MHWLYRVLLASLGLLSLVPVATAQDKVRIRDVRVGFTYGDEDYYKAGCWAPITVDVEAPAADFKGFLRVETTDGDGASSRNIQQIFVPRQSDREPFRTFITYLKIGESSGTVRLSLVQGDDPSGLPAARFTYPEDNRPYRPTMAQQPDTKIVLALTQPKWFDESTPDFMPVSRNWRFSFQTDITKLPEHWWGYQALDTIVLPTSGEWTSNVARQLANDEKRSQALMQWVKMGGHLVVSVSSNVQFVSNKQSFPLEPLLPAQIDPAMTVGVERFDGVRILVDKKFPKEKRPNKDDLRNFGGDMVRLTPRHSAEPLAFEQSVKLPSIVHAPYGLGRITLVAFDLDQGSFMLWGNRREFLSALLGLRYDSTKTMENQWQYRQDFERNDLTFRLRSQLEHFGEVKPIPFGWVALFIFIYILIVGPFDYLFLKKIMKYFTGQERLEWTWVTFPLVVLLVSLGAYYLAHYLKGDELRINKVDLVDIDPHLERAYGSTWFTVFSPSLQHYDVGLEPVGIDGKVAGRVVGWMPRAAEVHQFGGRSRSPSIFQRTYDFLGDGDQMAGVPINVWSMKTFTGRWETPLPKGKPAIAATLKAESKLLEGTITNNLGVALQDCRVVYREKVYQLGTLAPAQQAEIDKRNFQTGLTGLTQGGWSTNQIDGVFDLLRRATFYDSTRSANPSKSDDDQNNFLEFVDQTWRLQEFHEAIMIGVIPKQTGGAAEVNEANALGCKLAPFAPNLKGTMSQATVVRVFLPVTVDRSAQ